MSWDFGGGGTGASSGGPSPDNWSDLGSPAPSRGAAGGFDRGFDTSPGSSPSSARAGGATAPVVWLVLGVALGVVAVVIHVAADGFWPGLAGWFVGGPVAIGALAGFVNRDTARRADPWYAESAIAPWGRRLLVVVSLLAVVLNSLSIADFFSRGGF